MDTPGLLPRVDQARNEMELLTLASMEHLPSVVLFVMDFTGKKIKKKMEFLTLASMEHFVLTLSVFFVMDFTGRNSVKSSGIGFTPQMY